jgi:DNA polymerase III subunit epsilon
MKKQKEIFLDLETNMSLNYKTGTITEIGIVYRVGGKIVKRLEIKKDIYKALLKFLDSIINKYDKEDKAYFIAYNATFDTNFIRELFLKNGNVFYGSYFRNPSICVMQMAAAHFKGKKDRPENFKLSTVCKFMGIRVIESELHGALYDISITKDLYNKLKKA